MLGGDHTKVEHRVCHSRIYHLNRVVREGLTERVTFEKRPKSDEGPAFQAEGTSS